MLYNSKGIMILDERGILWGIFGILFVLSVTPVALGQQDDSALSESQTIKIIEAIHQLETKMAEKIVESENRMREYVDKKFTELDTKFANLDKEVAVLKNTDN